jgi:hypothetical protein
MYIKNIKLAIVTYLEKYLIEDLVLANRKVPISNRFIYR